MRHIIFPKLLFFTLTSITCSLASEITYRKVADTDDALPIVEGPWAGFYSPAISDGKVAFLAYQPAFSPLSLFAEFDGKLVHVASNGSSIPEDGRTISIGSSSRSTLVYHKNKIYLEVHLSSDQGSNLGVVEYSSNGLRVAFDEATVNAHAGTSLSWFSFHDLSIGPDDKVVRALSGPQIESSSSSLWLIGFDGLSLTTINEGTSLPPSTTRFTPEYAIYEEGFATNHANGDVQFRRNHLGHLQTLDSGLAELISPDVPVFTDQIYGNGRWFAIQERLRTPGTNNNLTALIGWSAGKWFEIVREGDSTQDGTVITALSDIESPRYSIDGNSLLFRANTVDGRALFLFRNGEVRRLIGRGDSIEGQEVAGAFIDRNSLEGNKFSFVARLTDGKEAVYVGDVSALYPAPTSNLQAQITLTGAHTGQITANSTIKNRVYHLLQSDDLEQRIVVDSIQGSNSTTQTFNFDNSTEAPKQKFYWVEEANYAP